MRDLVRFLWIIVAFVLLVFIANNAIGQTLPPICQAPYLMTSTCKEACLICDINGFTGRNTSTVSGEEPPGFCTTTNHNMQWIGFMAGTEDLILEVDVFNCRGRSGLEMGIYEGIDCKNYRLVSNCDGDILPNTTVRLVMKEKLKVGQHYYFVMDGNQGDVCNYKVRVISGSTKVNPLANSGIITGPDTLCENSNGVYSVSNVIGAVKYEWKLNGTVLGYGQNVNFSTAKFGDYQLCVQASNACDIAPPECKTIRVNQRSFHSVDTSICQGNCVYLKDTTICNAGKYFITYQNFLGCDSLIEFTLTFRPAVSSTLTRSACVGDTIQIANQKYSSTGDYLQQYLNWQGCDSLLYLSLNFIDPVHSPIAETICQGDTIRIGNDNYFNEGKFQQNLNSWQGCDSILDITIDFFKIAPQNISRTVCIGDTIVIGSKKYFQSGNYSQVFDSFNGCDSVVNINLNFIVCNIGGVSSFSNLKCNQDKSGSLNFSVDSGTPPFTYRIEKNPLILISNGQIQNLYETVTLQGLDAGHYEIYIKDNFGNQKIIYQTITQPEILQSQVKLSDYNGYQISCSGSTDGRIDLSTQGGTKPYRFSWNNSSTDSILMNLASGEYIVTILDANDCPIELQVNLLEPSPLNIRIKETNPTCTDSYAGKIVIENISGAVPPILYSLNNGKWDSVRVFSKLNSGIYNFTFRDKNKCPFQYSVTLSDPAKIKISQEEDHVIELGDSIDIDIDYVGMPESVKWVPELYLKCNDCVTNNAKPNEDIRYSVIFESIDGCLDSINFIIRILKNRDVWPPNVFSPNNDGINDFFTLFGTKQIKQINSMMIYSRWGELLYHNTKIQANNPYIGWNGIYKGHLLSPGVYTWIADVEFLDGYIQTVSGDITLIR